MERKVWFAVIKYRKSYWLPSWNLKNTNLDVVKHFIIYFMFSSENYKDKKTGHSIFTKDLFEIKRSLLNQSPTLGWLLIIHPYKKRTK